MTEHSVWLPFPPSTNNLFSQGVVKGKMRRFPSKQYKAWRKEAIIRLIAARLPRFSEPVVIKLALTPKDCRRRDASNYIKAVEDALVEARVLIDDDQRYVKAVVPYWENPAANAGVRITIRHAKPSEEALNGAERKALARLKRIDGYRISKRPAGAGVRGLIEKGKALVLPGLFEGTLQGYRLK